MKVSCGIIPYRINKNGEYEFFVAHPGGWYNQKKDVWYFLKGGKEDDESVIATAIREFQEESSFKLDETHINKLRYLGSVLQNPNKTVFAYSLNFGDINPEECHSNLCEDGVTPEMDKYKWMPWKELKDKTHKKHIPLYTKIMNKPNAYLMIGYPGSGKSTWIKQNLSSDVIIVSRDIIRNKLGYTNSPDEKVVLSKADEKKVTEYENNFIIQLLNNGIDIVVDDINIGKYRSDMINLLKNNGAKVIGVNMNTPIETCINRRKGQITTEAMYSIKNKYIPIKETDVDELINVKDNTND